MYESVRSAFERTRRLRSNFHSGVDRGEIFIGIQEDGIGRYTRE